MNKSSAFLKTRYKKHFQQPTRVRKSKVSRDQGFYEDDDCDSHSVTSVPTTRIRKNGHQPTKVSRKLTVLCCMVVIKSVSIIGRDYCTFEV